LIYQRELRDRVDDGVRERDKINPVLARGEAALTAPMDARSAMRRAL
jgi:hypothetical protein